MPGLRSPKELANDLAKAGKPFVISLNSKYGRATPDPKDIHASAWLAEYTPPALETPEAYNEANTVAET